MRTLTLATYAFGALVSLAPWLAHAVQLSPHPQHSDLWIALGVFGVGLFVESAAAGRGPAIAQLVLGLAAVGITAANLGDLMDRAGETGGVAGHLAEAARQRLFTYGAVALTGIVLSVSGLARLRSRERS